MTRGSGAMEILGAKGAWHYRQKLDISCSLHKNKSRILSPSLAIPLTTQ